MQLDQTASLRAHIETTYKKASGRLYLLKRVRPQLTIEAALTIYKTMLIPLFTYCSILTGNPSKTFQSKVQALENRARRIIFQGNAQRERSKLATIRELTQKRICLQVFKCIKGELCDNFDNYFTIMRNKTRNNNNILRLPKIKLEICRNSFFFNGALEFNKLPIKIRSTESVNNFLSIYKETFNI